eukprot:TRINITY_DN344_c0_g1_i2.p1 TRINITY_DN344_c0_g1~~TRINITY_DN344_c0_g1_i2.p1  ORF type:complete len:393 (+),score=96.02 TRINITY_DN344_c0_g1_i2:83-1180(+)
MSRVDDYRETVELFDLLQKSGPTEKHGSQDWHQSLRGEGAHFVPVGNTFSGLFCKIKKNEQPTIETIRRPQQPLSSLKNNINVARDSKRPKGASNMWRGVLKEHGHKIRKQMARLNMNSLKHIDAIEIVGTPLFDTNKQTDKDISHTDAASRNAASHDVGGQEPEVVFEPKTNISEVENSIGAHSLASNFSRCSFLMEPRCSPIECMVGQMKHIEVKVRNTGSTTLYLDWKPLATAIHHTSKVVCVENSAILLPQDERNFLFYFESDSPGVFVEQFTLNSVPIVQDEKQILTIKAICKKVMESKSDLIALKEELHKNAFHREMKEIVGSMCLCVFQLSLLGVIVTHQNIRTCNYFVYSNNKKKNL